MTIEQIRTLIAAKVEERGSQQQAADWFGISPQYLNDIIHGRREPGPKVLGRLGIRIERVYKAVRK